MKRFWYFEHKGADYILDNPNTELDFIDMLDDCLEAEDIVDLLNEQEETIKELDKYCVACDDTLMAIQELTGKLLSVEFFAGVKTQADYCKLLHELDHKDLSFLHDCIEAINKCDLMKMEELKGIIKEDMKKC